MYYYIVIVVLKLYYFVCHILALHYLNTHFCEMFGLQDLCGEKTNFATAAKIPAGLTEVIFYLKPL